MILLNVFLFIVLSVNFAVGSDVTDIADVTKKCCSSGAVFARDRTASRSDCTTMVPLKVAAAYSELCRLVSNECCYQYFDNKLDCDEGVDIAFRRNDCASSISNTSKSCCSECLKGKSTGANGGVCFLPIGKSSDDTLPADAFQQCCRKSYKKKTVIFGASSEKRKSNTSDQDTKDRLRALPSVCEEYAPNELCAHNCIPIPGSYRCECNAGFKLMADGRNCVEIEKNRCNSRNPCQHKCTDNGMHVKCSCRRGYQLQSDGKSCKDIDECKLEPPMCRSDLECHNTHGSYKCMPKYNNQERGNCPPGFTKNLTNNACDDVNECMLLHPPCPVHLCENTIGGYKCGGVNGDPANFAARVSSNEEDRCPQGFRSVGDEECVDVDECAAGTDECNKISQFCINTRGSFYCQDMTSKHCPPGFKIDSKTNKCEDIDECQDNNKLCPSDKVCVNVPGAYDCKLKTNKRTESQNCPEGMRLILGSAECEDIDECFEGTHLCDQHQSCLNTNGSHECHCKPGFELDPMLGACVDVNECATDQNDCLSSSQRCDNTVGSYICVRFVSCGTGYILHHSSSKCEDIDECALGTHNCARAGPDFNCLNIPGSFRCVRKEKTTPSPDDYEYYYDSEEDNSTSPEPNKDIQTTTTTTPSSNMATQKTTASTKPTEPQSQVVIDSRIQEVEPKPEYKYETDNRIEETNKGKTPEIPKEIFINETKESAVTGVKNQDGSILVDTGDVKLNTWTKIKEKPEVVCQPGFEADDYGACVDIDECSTNRHVCSGLTEVCHNNMGGYICECANGFRRDLLTRVCVMIATTTSTTSAPDTSNNNISRLWGYPVNKHTSRPFRPRNQCDVGYHKNSVTEKCEDINECTNGLANCAAVEICVNTEGGYRCECPPNWQLDKIRQRCTPIKDKNKFPPGYSNLPDAGTQFAHTNVVVLQPGTPGESMVEPSLTDLGSRGSLPKCPWGYRLGVDNVCTDIDECSEDTSICGQMQICTNLPGGYTCSCPQGHKMVGDHLCEDIDECALAGYKPICSEHADCINTVGSYQCKCHSGFTSAPANDKVCIDVDECTESRQGSLCQHRCNNVWGGYKCSCHRGYRLNADNQTCSDVNECLEYKHKNLCMGKCLNEPGSYKCSCPQGYRLSEDKRTCIDIDECETGIAPCSPGQPGVSATDHCVNTRGGYRCEKINCLPGYSFDNKNRCSRIETKCQFSDWECLRQPSTYSYNYITFVSKLYIYDSVDIFTMRGPSWPMARMKFELKLVKVDAPPTVIKKADLQSFLLTPTTQNAVISIVESLEGPQTIELELSMELYSQDKFAGKPVAKIFIFISEYEF